MTIEELRNLRGKDVRIKDSWGYVVLVNEATGELMLSGWAGLKTVTKRADQIQQVRLPEDREN